MENCLSSSESSYFGIYIEFSNIPNWNLIEKDISFVFNISAQIIDSTEVLQNRQLNFNGKQLFFIK